MYTKVRALAKCNLFQRAIEKAFGASSNIESVMLGFTVNLDEKQKKSGLARKIYNPIGLSRPFTPKDKIIQ